jgi:hypothetical protein
MLGSAQRTVHETPGEPVQFEKSTYIDASRTGIAHETKGKQPDNVVIREQVEPTAQLETAIPL